MGCRVSLYVTNRSVVYDEGSNNSRMIDLQLRREAASNALVLKVLLLGASDSGKSTVAKQMKILHTEGFCLPEKLHYKHTLHGNFLDALQHIARGVRTLQIEVPREERELVRAFGDSNSANVHCLYESGGLLELALKFLKFHSVQTANRHLTAFYVPDNTEYLLRNADRILQHNFVPTNEDIVQARQTTKCIYEILFTFKQFTIRLIDVGGQRTERRKWIHCFEGVAAIRFIASLSCYNQVLPDEEDSQIVRFQHSQWPQSVHNQMTDTIELCKSIYRNKFLRSSAFILFLNKSDLFAKKLRYDPLQRYYPAFGEIVSQNFTGEQLFQAGIKFFEELLFEVKGQDKRPIYMHVTNATDTRNIDFVFNAAYDIIAEKCIQRAGMS